jgi:diguanylate cyclase
MSASLTARQGLVVLGGLLAGSWLAGRAVGGAAVVPPHWFYVPIVFAAIRFGALGAAGTAVGSTFLAGPLLSPQATSDWLSRGGFFLLIGLVISLLLQDPAGRRVPMLQTLRTDRALRRAHSAGELEVHYQPVLDIRGRRQRVIGCEALLRWNHPRDGLLSAAHFIAAAEETGFIHELGQWVFDQACAATVRWSTLLDDTRFLISVNLSARQLGDRHLVERIESSLQTSGVHPDRVCLEITETAAMDDLNTTHDQLRALKALGLHLAIDDFGTGYSSLAYVGTLPVDIIKIDGSFITRVTDDTTTAHVVETIIDLAHTLGLKTVAEWVETKQQADFLRSNRCDYGQGFHLGVPAAPTVITAALQEQQQQRATVRSRQRQIRPVA